MRPRLLDLYCGAGGAAKGYQQAGFEVVGVDAIDQPRYAGDFFIQADALDYLPFMHKNERAYTDALGCNWMTNVEGRDAIPPAYTEWIGENLIAYLEEQAA